jgi:hypothetical protein
MTTDTDMHGAGQRARTATLVAAGLGFAVIQLDVFVVNVASPRTGTRDKQIAARPADTPPVRDH